VDAHAASALASDPKQRTENLMIVDLIRNDLSRIAVPGSVHVPALFRVETYPTIHQMVSDVTATMADGTGIEALLQHIYPCGSITGAPKIRAMEIIHALEAATRGAYTGSIGFIAPGGEAAFNVAIRTLALPSDAPPSDAPATAEQDAALHGGQGCATIIGGDAILGLGSGIVADSDVAAEWQECLAKGEFIRVASGQFDLFETMAFDPLDGVLRLDAHLARLGDSARALGFSFDRHAVRNMLQHASFHQQSAARVRVRLSPAGNVAVLFDALPDAPTGPVPVKIVPLPVAPLDFRLRHKTSDRAFYDCARHNAGAFEVAFTHPNGQLTEGSFTSLFVERDGRLLTPPLSLGLLPGVLRAELIAEGKAVEAPLMPADLANGFFIGNALRGLLPAILVDSAA
jgi:para-aminobenzoate synthetase/4-amino-4-deoxychorismate lyase